MDKFKKIWQTILTSLWLLWAHRQLNHLYRKDRDDRAIQLAQHVLDLSDRGFDNCYFSKDLRAIAKLMGLASFGWGYQKQKRYSEAETLYKQFLEFLSESSLSPQIQKTIAEPLIGKLALLYYDQGRKSEAEYLLHQLQDLGNPFDFIKDVVETITLTNRSISIFTYEGDYSKAQERCERALDLSRRLFSDSSPMVVGTMQNLAVIYKNQGKYRQAEKLLVQALNSAREQQGFERPDGVASILNNLASLYWECGLFSEAETSLEEALTLSQNLSRSQYIHMAASLNGLANVYQDRGQYSKAEPLYNQALELMQQNQKKMHPKIMQLLDNMAERIRDVTMKLNYCFIKSYI